MNARVSLRADANELVHPIDDLISTDGCPPIILRTADYLRAEGARHYPQNERRADLRALNIV